MYIWDSGFNVQFTNLTCVYVDIEVNTVYLLHTRAALWCWC